MRNNELITFSNEVFGSVRAVTIDEESWFVGKDIAEALGYADTNKAVKQHVDKEDLKVCNRKGYADLYPTLWDNENDFANKVLINESGIYSLIFGSQLDSAKAFKKWVKEILKQLRTTGVVILESATEEAIDYQAKYGRYRIRKTFTESTDIRATYEEYASLSKIERDAKRIDNKDRIKNCKTILDVIEIKLAENVTTMRGSEVLALRELALDVQTDITRLHNKMNSGIKSAMTKKIQQLEEENEELKNQIDEDDFYFIDRHPFSFNFQYSYSSNGVVKSAAYCRWINNLHLEKFLPEEYPGVDFAQPIRITLMYGHRKGMDTINFSKSIIDQISQYYSFNDSLVVECVESLHGYVDNYSDGYIYVKIENIDDPDQEQ